MTHVDITHVDITHVDMTHVDITHVDITHVDMTHVDMTQGSCLILAHLVSFSTNYCTFSFLGLIPSIYNL